MVRESEDVICARAQIEAAGGRLDAVDVPSVLLEMRRFRMGLIQTPDQLRFSYLAILEGARALARSVSTRL